MALATYRQTWAIFCATKLDVRNIGLSVEQASDLIGRSKAGEDIGPEVAALVGIEAPARKAPARKPNWAALWDKAHAAGMTAGKAVQTSRMVVQQHADPLDDGSEVTQQWVVPEGPCGFAWVQFPGTSGFARWAKKAGLARPAYGGGYRINVGQFNQSYERKYAYAVVAAEVLRAAGVERAYGDGRLD